MQDNSFDKRVAQTIAKMTKNEAGNWELPKDVSVSEDVLYAARAEKKFRDTQAAYTKARQEVKAKEEMNKQLTNHLINNATLHLNSDQRFELEELKAQDPEKWRVKLTAYENEAKEILANKIKGFGENAERLSSEEVKQIAIREVSKLASNVKVDDIEDSLPRNLTKDLERGKISVEDFVNQAKRFLNGQVEILNEADPTSKSLSNVPGGSTPSSDSSNRALVENYAKMVF